MASAAAESTQGQQSVLQWLMAGGNWETLYVVVRYLQGGAWIQKSWCPEAVAHQMLSSYTSGA